jgi:hypothetical protein
LAGFSKISRQVCAIFLYISATQKSPFSFFTRKFKHKELCKMVSAVLGKIIVNILSLNLEDIES